MGGGQATLNQPKGALIMASKSRYRSAMDPSAMIEESPIPAVLSNPRLPDNPIIACNDAFIKLSGYDRNEIIGHNCRFLRGEDTEPELTEALRTGIKAGQPVMVEILNYKKDGTPFRNALMIAPIFGSSGELEYFLGSQVEVTENVTAAAQLRREKALAQIDELSLRQKQVLVQIAAGKLNKQIAFDLGLHERTVKLHRSALLRALGVQTNADAIRIAIEAGF